MNNELKNILIATKKIEDFVEADKFLKDKFYNISYKYLKTDEVLKGSKLFLKDGMVFEKHPDKTISCFGDIDWYNDNIIYEIKIIADYYENFKTTKVAYYRKLKSTAAKQLKKFAKKIQKTNVTYARILVFKDVIKTTHYDEYMTVSKTVFDYENVE